MKIENKLHILTLGFAGENQKRLKSFDILRVKNINPLYDAKMNAP